MFDNHSFGPIQPLQEPVHGPGLAAPVMDPSSLQPLHEPMQGPCQRLQQVAQLLHHGAPQGLGGLGPEAIVLFGIL